MFVKHKTRKSNVETLGETKGERQTKQNKIKQKARNTSRKKMIKRKKSEKMPWQFSGLVFNLRTYWKYITS